MKRKAEKEDGCHVSVGGLVGDIEALSQSGLWQLLRWLEERIDTQSRCIEARGPLIDHHIHSRNEARIIFAKAQSLIGIKKEST